MAATIDPRDIHRIRVALETNARNWGALIHAFTRLNETFEVFNEIAREHVQNDADWINYLKDQETAPEEPEIGYVEIPDEEKGVTHGVEGTGEDQQG